MNIEDKSNEIKAKEERLKTTNIGAIKKFYNQERDNLQKDNSRMREILSNLPKIKNVINDVKIIKEATEELNSACRKYNKSLKIKKVHFLDKEHNSYEEIEILKKITKMEECILRMNDTLVEIKDLIRPVYSYCHSLIKDEDRDYCINASLFIDLVEISELLRELKYSLYYFLCLVDELQMFYEKYMTYYENIGSIKNLLYVPYVDMVQAMNRIIILNRNIYEKIKEIIECIHINKMNF